MLRQLFPGEHDSHPIGTEGSSTLHHTIEIPEQAFAVNKTISTLELSKHDVSVVSLQRGDERIPHPSEETQLLAGDLLILYGTAEALENVEKYIRSGE